jgi:hypothetical protein
MSDDALKNFDCPEGITCPNLADAKSRSCFYKAIKKHEATHCSQWKDRLNDEQKIIKFRQDMQTDPLCDETPPLCGCGVQVADPCSEEFSRLKNGFKTDIDANVLIDFIYTTPELLNSWENAALYFDMAEYNACMGN